MAFENYASGVLASLLILLSIKIIFFKRITNAPLPPGPKPLPLVGNIFDSPDKLDYKEYHKKCRDLNTDILYLNVLGTPMVVLDTYEACTELFDKKSSIYSGRMRSPMVNELMGWDFDFAFMDYGDRWREQRRLMHQAFNATAAKEFRPIQVKATRAFLKRLLKGNVDVIKELRQLSGGTILNIAYGIEVESYDNPYIKMAEAGVYPLLEAGVPGAFLVDTFPLLKYVPAWVPGAGFKRKAKEWRKLARSMVNAPFAATKEAMKKGTANPSFVMAWFDSMNENDGHSVQEEDIKGSAGTMYQAGSDSTAATLASCILALLEHPGVLKKAQQEIDSVVLPGNFPDFHDEESLPYITAIAKEILRWRVVAPIGLPHTLSLDDIYNGYHIPAGSVVTPNIWAILHDEKVYPNPELFDPERFMKNDEVAESRLEVAWGFGRRICTGRYMAFSTVWITLASMVALFDISKPIDENGNVIQPSHEYTASILPFPQPFRAVFEPRNTGAEALIKSGVGIQDPF